MSDLSHLGADGRARMVDVSPKPETLRRARAAALVSFSPGVLPRVLAGDLPKGGVLEVARLAGIQAAKRTAELIPLCHPIRLVDVQLTLEARPPAALAIEAVAIAVDRTGVEMEAMTAVSIAALTVYDMVKAIDRAMTVSEIRLLEKSGGKSGAWTRPTP